MQLAMLIVAVYAFFAVVMGAYVHRKYSSIDYSPLCILCGFIWPIAVLFMYARTIGLWLARDEGNNEAG